MIKEKHPQGCYNYNSFEPSSSIGGLVNRAIPYPPIQLELFVGYPVDLYV